MATLNVKNLPDKLYRKLSAQARRHRRSMAQEVTQILADTLDEAELLSLLDLRGLGKETWQGIDAAEHIERERRTWD